MNTVNSVNGDKSKVKKCLCMSEANILEIKLHPLRFICSSLNLSHVTCDGIVLFYWVVRNDRVTKNKVLAIKCLFNNCIFIHVL